MGKNSLNKLSKEYYRPIGEIVWHEKIVALSQDGLRTHGEIMLVYQEVRSYLKEEFLSSDNQVKKRQKRFLADSFEKYPETPAEVDIAIRRLLFIHFPGIFNFEINFEDIQIKKVDSVFTPPIEARGITRSGDPKEKFKLRLYPEKEAAIFKALGQLGITSKECMLYKGLEWDNEQDRKNIKEALGRQPLSKTSRRMLVGNSFAVYYSLESATTFVLPFRPDDPLAYCSLNLQQWYALVSQRTAFQLNWFGNERIEDWQEALKKLLSIKIDQFKAIDNLEEEKDNLSLPCLDEDGRVEIGGEWWIATSSDYYLGEQEIEGQAYSRGLQGSTLGNKLATAFATGDFTDDYLVRGGKNKSNYKINIIRERAYLDWLQRNCPLMPLVDLVDNNIVNIHDREYYYFPQKGSNTLADYPLANSTLRRALINLIKSDDPLSILDKPDQFLDELCVKVCIRGKEKNHVVFDKSFVDTIVLKKYTKTKDMNILDPEGDGTVGIDGERWSTTNNESVLTIKPQALLNKINQMGSALKEKWMAENFKKNAARFSKGTKLLDLVKISAVEELFKITINGPVTILNSSNFPDHTFRHDDGKKYAIVTQRLKFDGISGEVVMKVINQQDVQWRIDNSPEGIIVKSAGKIVQCYEVEALNIALAEYNKNMKNKR
jgi:hypothetical protein